MNSWMPEFLRRYKYTTCPRQKGQWVVPIALSVSSFLSGSVLEVGRLKHANLGGVVAVVNADDAFLAAGGDDGAVGADADGVDEIGVAAEVADVAAAGVDEVHLGVAA